MWRENKGHALLLHTLLGLDLIAMYRHAYSSVAPGQVAEVGVGNVSRARVADLIVVRWYPYSSDIVLEILESV